MIFKHCASMTTYYHKLQKATFVTEFSDLCCMSNSSSLCFPSEVIEYARKIGIDVEKESELLYLAREGLLKELPAQWKPW